MRRGSSHRRRHQSAPLSAFWRASGCVCGTYRALYLCRGHFYAFSGLHVVLWLYIEHDTCLAVTLSAVDLYITRGRYLANKLFLRYVGGTSSKPVLSMPPTPVTRCPRYLPAISRRNVGTQPDKVRVSCRSLRFAPLASSHSGMYRANNLFLPYFICGLPTSHLLPVRHLSSDYLLAHLAPDTCLPARCTRQSWV